MADPRLRQITIKTGVLKRITKEKTVYAREVLEQKARIEKLKAAGKDDHVMRKVSVLFGKKIKFFLKMFQQILRKTKLFLEKFIFSKNTTSVSPLLT